MSTNGQRLTKLYQDVDSDSADLQTFMISFLDFQNALPAMREAKQIMIELSQLQAGDQVLDAGCGLGDDSRELGAIVGDSGLAVGIDTSDQMIQIAKKRSAEALSREEFFVGDVHSIDYPDNTFDVIRSERTLQWLHDPNTALDEMIRVLKPGGRIVICETDYGTTFNANGDPDMMDLILDAHQRRVPSPREARMIPKRYRDRGLIDIEVRGVLVFIDAETLRESNLLGLEMIQQMHQSGVLSDEQSQEMGAETRRALQTNSAYTVGVMIITAGTKTA